MLVKSANSLKSSKDRKEQSVPINDGQYWFAKTKNNTTNCSSNKFPPQLSLKTGMLILEIAEAKVCPGGYGGCGIDYGKGGPLVVGGWGCVCV